MKTFTFMMTAPMLLLPPHPLIDSSDPDPYLMIDDALEFLKDLELDGPTFQRCAGQSIAIVHPPRGAKLHIIACFDALVFRLAHNLLRRRTALETFHCPSCHALCPLSPQCKDGACPPEPSLYHEAPLRNLPPRRL